jgi:tetratricopeptide (TPR) repeat protein
LRVPDAIANLLAQARQARFENPADAKRYLVEAVALARAAKTEDRLQLAQALTDLGQIERDTQHTDEALRLYGEAETLYRTAKAWLKLAHTVRHIADICREKGLLKIAEPAYQEALEIYRAHKETLPLDLANTIRGLALLKEALGEKQEAKALWEEAGKLYASANVEAGVKECDRRLALLA